MGRAQLNRVFLVGSVPLSLHYATRKTLSIVDDFLALRFMDLGGTSVGMTFYVNDWAFGP